MRLAIALVLLIGCAKRDVDPPAPGSAAPHVRVDPTDEPFVTARKTATTVTLPYDSGTVKGAALHAVKVASKAGDKIRVRVEQPTTKTALTIYQWWPTSDAWGIAADGFTPAEPGSSFETVRTIDAGGETIVAVEAKSPAEFRVILSRP